MAADREDKWQDGLRVNYTVENFGIIDDTDSGGDVSCCMLPKHAGPVGQAEPEETQGESSEVSVNVCPGIRRCRVKRSLYID